MQHRRHIRWALAIVPVLVSVAAADEPLAGRQLKLTASLLAVRSNDTAIDLGRGQGSADDPVLHGGSLRIVSIEGDVFDQTVPLPAGSWRYLSGAGRSSATPSGVRRSCARCA